MNFPARYRAATIITGLVLGAISMPAVVHANSEASPLGRGTLVAMVTTADGLVVAADSRLTLAGGMILCDNLHKITELAVDRSVFITTNYTSVRNWRGVPLNEICNRPDDFNINDVIKSAIDIRPALAANELNALPAICIEAIEKFTASNPNTFDTLRGGPCFNSAWAPSIRSIAFRQSKPFRSAWTRTER